MTPVPAGLPVPAGSRSSGQLLSFVLNGLPITIQVDAGRSLLWVLREELDLTGTKQACDCQGECGACTVLLDGQAVRSCLTPIVKVAGRHVTTIEGLATERRAGHPLRFPLRGAMQSRSEAGLCPRLVPSVARQEWTGTRAATGSVLHPLQQAFIDHGAVQCGYCTPGMIMAGVALLNRRPDPTREEIVEALEGNLCRCTGYTTIVAAVESAAAVLRGEPPRRFAMPSRSETEWTGLRLPPREHAGIIGGSQVRLDAEEKVTGEIRYAEDIKMPGLHHAALVRSPLPHAQVLDIDPRPALKLPGVVRVLTAADVPGLNSLEGYSRGEPLLTALGDTVRMIGAPVALVVACSPEAAQAGAAAVRVDYRALPYTYDAVRAMQDDAVRIYPEGNVLNTHEIHFAEYPVPAHWAGRFCGGHLQEALPHPLSPVSSPSSEPLRSTLCLPALPGRQGRTGQAASAVALTLLEAHYETPFAEHSAMERETVLSYVEDDPLAEDTARKRPAQCAGTGYSAGGRVVVVAGHQEPHWAQGWIAAMLGLPPERVRVIVPPMGGAFGGKQDPWPLMAGALAAYHMRQPVRLTYSRRESFDASPKRHPYQMDLRVAATADGSLQGLRMRIVANTGAYDCDGYYIPQYALVAGGGPYRWQAVDAQAWAVYTNAAKAGQMRGFGTPQSTFARECALDELAALLSLDPLELRLKNAIDDDTVTFLGYPVAETVGYRQCLEAIRPYYRTGLTTAEALAERRDGEGSPWRRGVGLAGMWYRFGKAGRITCEAHAELGLDGQITLFFAAPDYGQGTTTVMAQLAAEAMGLPPHSLRLVNADTAVTPDSGIQGASRSTYWVGGAVARAAHLLADHIRRTAAEMLDSSPHELSLTPVCCQAPGGAAVSLADVAAEMQRIGLSRRVAGVFAPGVDPSPSPRGLPYVGAPEYLPFFVTGVHLAEVDVNVETGQVQVARVVAVHDVGRVINPEGAKGQVEGAVVMGVGAALMEEYIPGVSTGFSDYYLPTIRCTPQIEVILVEVPGRWGPHGAKGLGEAAALPTAPAILNAIYHACGARVRTLPATPERVLAAIRLSRGEPSSLRFYKGTAG